MKLSIDDLLNKGWRLDQIQPYLSEPRDRVEGDWPCDQPPRGCVERVEIDAFARRYMVTFITDDGRMYYRGLAGDPIGPGARVEMRRDGTVWRVQEQEGSTRDVEAALEAVAAEVSAAADRACPYWGGQPVALDPPVTVSVDDLFAVRTHNTGEDAARCRQLSAELARREQAAFAEVKRRAASWPVCRYGGTIRLSLMPDEESRGVEWRCNCGGVTK